MNTQTSYFKKALVVLMAVMMVFTMMPSMAWAAETFSEGESISEENQQSLQVYDTEQEEDTLQDRIDPVSSISIQWKRQEIANLVTREGDTFLIQIPDTLIRPSIMVSGTSIGTAANYYQCVTNGVASNCNKFNENGTDLLSVLIRYVIPANLPNGKKVISTLKVGEYDTDKKEFTNYKEYTLIFSKKMMADKLTVSSEGTPLQLNSVFDNIHQHDYSAVLPENATTVTLNCTPKTALAAEDDAGTYLAYSGAESAIMESDIRDNGATFEIQKLPKENSTPYIPLTVAYRDPQDAEAAENAISSTYKIFLETGTYYPSVTLENEARSYEYDRCESEVIPLSVTATGEEGIALSYQWQVKEPLTSFKNIEGDEAKTNAYEPKTDVVIPLEYRCAVSCVLNGVTYTTYSEVVSVTIRPTTVSEPKIESITADFSCYRGEEVYVRCFASSPDYKANICLQWYDARSGKEITDGFTSDSDGTSSHSGSKLLVDTTEPGEYQFKCKVTSKIQDISAVSESSVITVTVKPLEGFENIKGKGTETEPYELNTVDDFLKIKELVEKGQSLEGGCFKLMHDIELPQDWEPIGGFKKAPTITEIDDGTQGGANVNPFMGILDGGNHTITIPEGGKALFKFVRKATIRNLNVYGKKIAGSALITDSFIDYGPSGKFNNYVPWRVKIDNVTLKEGSRTLGAGFLEGGGSGSNTVTIMNSTVEKDVVIGYEGRGGGGSFVGALNGAIINCVSYATVNGSGGIAGNKGQSMGDCSILNCGFLGTVNSTGEAGGIIGSGYDGNGTAPNTPVVHVQNCYVVADISGKGCVGGILGTEPECKNCWSNGAGTISNNYFKGTLTETSGEGYVGGIVGFMKSYNKYQGFDNNYYFVDSVQKVSGIGMIEKIITKDDPVYGANGIEGEFKEDAVCIPVSAKYISSGKLAAALNSGAHSSRNWVQSEKGYPVISKEAVPYKLELSGNYPTNFNVGDKFSHEGMIITAVYTDGTKKALTEKEMEDVTFTGYESTVGKKEITVRLQAAETRYTVSVLYEKPSDVTVTFTLWGDSLHNTTEKECHTLKDGNLELWIPETPYTVTQNDTVDAVLNKALAAYGMKASNPSGNYVDSITLKNGTKLGELSNGPNSGWMYTLNGKHPMLGVAEQYLNNGDKIVFHYTDDYTKEEGSEHWNTPGGVVEEVKDVTTDTKTGTTTAPTEVKVSEKTNADGTKTKVAEVKVSADNQKEILKQAKANKSKEIILNVSSKSVGDATKADVTLDKSFIDSIIKDTDAKLTIQTPFGDKTYTQEELKAMSEAATGSTVTVAVEKAAEQPTDDAAANIAKAKSVVKDMKLVARSSKTAKKNIKAVLKSDTKTNASIKELKDLGFTVKYRFYRSTKKAASYKSTVTKKVASYTNTSGKKGTKYFYKIQVRVYDENGKLIAKTALKQCKYASRTWTKAK